MTTIFYGNNNSKEDYLVEVPVDWNVSRLRFKTNINPSKQELSGIPTSTEVSFLPMEAVCEYGGLILDSTRPLGEVCKGYTYFKEKDVIIAKITPCFENGKGAIAEDLKNRIGFGSTELHVLRPYANLDNRYLFYLTMSNAFRSMGKAQMYGAGGQKRVPEKFIKNFRHPFPKIDIQKLIANFLDRETSRIDSLIEKKQRQIELLKEKRSALISHAVTKGLNHDVKMKDSGIEWLGEIPEHWDTFKTRRISKRIQTGSTPPTKVRHYYDEGEVPWYGPGSFGTDLVLKKPVKFLNVDALEDGAARLFHKGSTMIVTIGATIGKVGYIGHDSSCNQQITVITFKKSYVLGKFAAYQLKNLEPILRGIAPSTTLPILNQQQIGDLFIALPGIKEQEKIIKYLDCETFKIDSIINKVNESINILQEYRTALISAAVTGKIDVRKEDV